MKLLLVLAHTFFLQTQHPAPDSINVRVYNHSNYYIEKYIIIIRSVKYTFANLPTHSYSEYKKLPYIYNSNVDQVTLLKKKFLGGIDHITGFSAPMDDTDEKRLDSGRATLILDIGLKHKLITIKTNLKQE